MSKKNRKRKKHSSKHDAERRQEVSMHSPETKPENQSGDERQANTKKHTNLAKIASYVWTFFRWWTSNRIMALFTVVIGGIGIIQASIYSSQLDEMRIDQRAWLGIKFVPAQPAPNSPFTWPLTFNNVGKTPAKNIRGMVIIRYLPVDSPIDLRTIEEMRAAGIKQVETTPLWMAFRTGVLFPNDLITNQFTYAQGMVGKPQKNTWDSALQDRYAKGEIYIEMNGRFDYDDAAGNAHWTQICNITTSPGQVIPLETSKACVAHNSIDNNK
jgi:hypothetical protein